MPMEDSFFKILCLIIIYAVPAILRHLKKLNTEAQPAEARPEDFPPPLASAPDWGDAWEEAAQEAPANTLYQPAPTPPTAASPVDPKLHSTPQATSQKQVQPKIDRVLHRYSGWKKAIIMHELIRPYNYIA